MMYYGPGMGGWGMTFMIIANLVFWGLLIFVAVLVARYVREGKIASAPPAEASPQQIAAQRFARGEITEEEYLHLLQILSGVLRRLARATPRAQAHNPCRVRTNL
jgi:putative membrane protein